MTAPSWLQEFTCNLTRKRYTSSLQKQVLVRFVTFALSETNAPANLKGKYQAHITYCLDSCHTTLDTHY